jgi:hypothetical protein
VATKPLTSKRELGARAMAAATTAAATAPGRRIGGTTIGELALSHHWPEQHDRCANLGGRLVCRRCAVLYPVTLGVMVLGFGGLRWSKSLDPLLLFALPLPLVVDYVAEHVGMIAYSARRQIITTAIAAPALGTAFGRYLDHQGDGLFWQVVALYSALCFLAFLVSQRRARKVANVAQQEMEASDPLINGFADREAFLRYLNDANSSPQ